MQKDTMILYTYDDIYKGDFYGTTDRFRNWKCTGNSLL